MYDSSTEGDLEIHKNVKVDNLKESHECPIPQIDSAFSPSSRIVSHREFSLN